jgi:GDP-D-mannose dehydratase
LDILRREGYGMSVLSGILFTHESPRPGAEFATYKTHPLLLELNLEWIPAIPCEDLVEEMVYAEIRRHKRREVEPKEEYFPFYQFKKNIK